VRGRIERLKTVYSSVEADESWLINYVYADVKAVYEDIHDDDDLVNVLHVFVNQELRAGSPVTFKLHPIASRKRQFYREVDLGTCRSRYVGPFICEFLFNCNCNETISLLVTRH
jgi:hypothetical protein